ANDAFPADEREVVLRWPLNVIQRHGNDRAGLKLEMENGRVLHINLQAASAGGHGAHTDDFSQQPAQIIDRVAQCENDPAALARPGRITGSIVPPGLPIREILAPHYIRSDDLTYHLFFNPAPNLLEQRMETKLIPDHRHE